MRAPLPSGSDLTRFIGPPLQDTFREILGTSDEEDVATAIGHYRARFSLVGLFENSVYQGIPDALSELAAAGYELRVATSKPHVFADRIIDHFELRGLIPRVYGSELSGERSDKGDLIGHVLAEESIESESACMIGDRRHDVVGAQEHGVLSIGVLWGFGDVAEMEAAAPHRTVAQVGELVDVVRELTRNCYSTG